MSEIRILPAARSLRPFGYAALAFLGVTTISRALLLVWLQDRVAATGGTGYILVQGLRFDLVALGILFAIPMALTPLLSRVESLHRHWFRLVCAYLVLVIGLAVFMEVATPPFIQEYDVRPNVLFIEYLKYPQEVFSMLFTGYRLEVAATILLTAASSWFVTTRLRAPHYSDCRSHPAAAAVVAFVALVTCIAAARSTLDHRPINPGAVAFSSDALVNSLPVGSLYSVIDAAYRLRHEDDGLLSASMDESIAVNSIRDTMRLEPTAFDSADIPNLHFQPATAEPVRPKNLVVIIEESLGADYVGSLGGLPLTPHLDALADDGIWFEQLYATGTRSARGLEAIVTGFPPTTSRAVLKLGRAQEDFFTFGEFLRRRGYDTSFIYGGEAQFDNMKGFFANNGFNTVFDKHDFVDPVYYGSWGASDEDVFRYANEVFEAYPADQPFFSVLFTTSNHSPWEFPDGRIELYEEPKATVHNAVKYADYAIGLFFEMARASSYWDNTVFVLVADHSSRVHGAELVPIPYFHIPGVILGGGVKPERWTRVASQIDLLPTALSLIGISGEHPAPGFDLTRSDVSDLPQRAMMQYGDIEAYRESDRVAIIRRGRAPAVYHYDENGYRPVGDDPDFLSRAAAMAAWPTYMYRDQKYRLP